MSLDDLHAIGWRDFLIWAWSSADMRAEFTAKTGLVIETVTAPINAAIDAATGTRESLAAHFIEWATREHWGLEYAPAAYRQNLEAQS